MDEINKSERTDCRYKYGNSPDAPLYGDSGKYNNMKYPYSDKGNKGQDTEDTTKVCIVSKSKSIRELKYISRVIKNCINNTYILDIIIRILLILLLVSFILGCSSKVYADSIDTSKQQAKTISALLMECVDQPYGVVGDTNISLAKAYMRSTESLVICQEISRGVIQGLDNTYFKTN